MKHLLSAIILVLTLTSCSENYSNGERIGLITQFSKTGIVWKSWEGELHVTQTGMNSTMNDFDFSIDNDKEDQKVIDQLDSAAEHGWKVKLTYHETFGKNWLHNRGETNHFITGVEILEKNMPGSTSAQPGNSTWKGYIAGKDSIPRGHIIDTIYLIIDKSR